MLVLGPGLRAAIRRKFILDVLDSVSEINVGSPAERVMAEERLGYHGKYLKLPFSEMD